MQERDLRRFARDISTLTKRLEQVERGQRTPQLQHASVHNRTLKFFDDEDHLVAEVGVHPDGSASIVHREGPVPPVPSLPEVEPSISGLSVSWDGSFAQEEGEEVPIPTDFAYVEVHVSDQSGFIAQPSTFKGVIPRSGGTLSVVPIDQVLNFVRLVAVSSAHKRSEPTDQVEGTPLPAVGPGSITETEIADDSISTPKLQANSVTAQKLSALLTLSSRIVSGDPDGPRVEMNETGLFAYDGDEVTFSIAADGSAFFSGNIQASNIYGSSLESSNFDPEDEELGIVGWRLGEDGSATFRNVTIGNDSYTISPEGQAVFQSISAESMTIAGEELGTLLEASGGRCISRTQITGTQSDPTDGNATAGSALFCRATISDVKNHMYLVHLDSICINPAAGAGHVGVLLRGQLNTPPTRTTGTFLGRLARDRTGGDAGLRWIGGSRNVAISGVSPGQDYHLAFFVESDTSGIGTRAVVDGVHLVSVFDMGRTEDVELLTYNLESDTTPTVQRTRIYNATYSGSWFNDSTFPSAKISDNDHLYQGRYSASGGTRYGKIGFNHSAIQSDLSGATINKIELRLSNMHSYSSSGLTARIGSHNNASEPTGSTSLTGDFNRWTFSWSKNQTKWVTLPNAFGNQLRDNTMKGITIGRTDAGTQGEYGYFRGASASASLRPQLKITYTK